MIIKDISRKNWILEIFKNLNITCLVQELTRHSQSDISNYLFFLDQLSLSLHQPSGCKDIENRSFLDLIP